MLRRPFEFEFLEQIVIVNVGNCIRDSRLPRMHANEKYLPGN